MAAKVSTKEEGVMRYGLEYPGMIQQLQFGDISSSYSSIR